MKLKSKHRDGAKVKKSYDAPQTPYRRLLAAPSTNQATRQRLRAQYAGLNPAQLKRDITRLQKMLQKNASARRQPTARTRHTGQPRPQPSVHATR
jgi:hypothetical protein